MIQTICAMEFNRCAVGKLWENLIPPQENLKRKACSQSLTTRPLVWCPATQMFLFLDVFEFRHELMIDGLIKKINLLTTLWSHQDVQKLDCANLYDPYRCIMDLNNFVDYAVLIELWVLTRMC